MNINKFSTIGYFVKNYFNWSMDYSELESCIEDLEVSYRLGDRGIPAKKAINMVRLLYIKTQGEAK
ncbi:MAG: hypothetical protein K2H45_15465 [Acetatifactor sp.]|nr:hypothetical protein [Acetatifactor sp.]